MKRVVCCSVGPRGIVSINTPNRHDPTKPDFHCEGARCGCAYGTGKEAMACMSHHPDTKGRTVAFVSPYRTSCGSGVEYFPERGYCRKAVSGNSSASSTGPSDSSISLRVQLAAVEQQLRTRGATTDKMATTAETAARTAAKNVENLYVQTRLNLALYDKFVGVNEAGPAQPGRGPQTGQGQEEGRQQ